MSTLKKYRVLKDIIDVNGTQEFEVEASSKQEAISKFNNNEGELVETDYEVTDLSLPMFDTLYEVEPPIEEESTNHEPT